MSWLTLLVAREMSGRLLLRRRLRVVFLPITKWMDGWMKKRRDSGRELGLALLKFVMESSVLGRRDGDGELGILPVSLPFAALIESSPFSPPSLPPSQDSADPD